MSEKKLQEYELLEKAEERGDKRYAMKPVEWIVYGMVALALTAVFIALLKNIGI